MLLLIDEMRKLGFGLVQVAAISLRELDLKFNVGGEREFREERERFRRVEKAN